MEISEATQGFASLGQVEGTRKFYYAVAKNATAFKRENKKMVEKRNEHLVGFEDFEKERQDKMQDFLKKDEKGKLVVVNGQPTFDDNKLEEWEKEFAKINKKHKGAWDLEQDRIKEFNEVFMKEVIEVEVHMIKEEDSPEKMKPSQAEYLLLMIE